MAKRRPPVVLPSWLKTFPEGIDILKFLERGTKRVKVGIDATSPTIHIGHLVPLRIAKKLQELGNPVHVVIGTTTAMLGDPSGRDKTRPILTFEEVYSNAEKIEKQIKRIMGEEVHVVLNHHIHQPLDATSFLHLCSHFTVTRILSRDAFRKRQAEFSPIGLHELSVPLLQGLDSVALESEIEIGGVDQTFNFDLTREIQVIRNLPPEICILTPIISGTDGRKMSKSFGNTVSFDLHPDDVFGRVMSISDEVMDEWFPLFSDMPISTTDPKLKKMLLAYEITRQVWTAEEAVLAQEHFSNTFCGRKIPENLPIIGATNLIDAIVSLRACSRTEARRFIENGAVKVNETRIQNPIPIKPEDVLQVGRFFGKIGPSNA